jgi:hypothetical protein
VPAGLPVARAAGLPVAWAVGLPLGWVASLPVGWLAEACEGSEVGLPVAWLADSLDGVCPGWATPAQYAVTLAAPPAAAARLRNATAFCAALPSALRCAYAVHSPYAG